MPRNLATSALIKPFVVLALPGMYLFYKYNQYKRQQQEQTRRKVTERELAHLNHKIDKLLCKLEENEPDVATSQEDECVICVNARATMQTFPCGHRVVCRKCFVKTIQMAVSQRLLPLRCVICRSKILRLKQGVTGGVTLPTSASQYCVGVGAKWEVPASASLYSMSSGTSSLSGMSSVSSATNSSVGSTRSSKASSSSSTCPGVGRHHVYRQPSGASLKRSQTHQMKMRLQEYKDPLAASCGPPASSVASCSSGSTGSGRLPPIQEFQREFRASRDRSGGAKDKPSASTRIRCAQKIVTQLENPAAAKKSYFRASPAKGLGKEQQSKASKKQEEKELKRKEKEEKENKRKEEKEQKRREKEENKRREREERKERDEQAKSKAKD
ncbi:arginine/serine-rich protein PNISR [Neocloeon triangulifer]|uniref:arginine/serine-rich protein PNISR n=1 Tax=Neocloeon triangulifer TaxID=2078957 RepID=UPI00286FA84F|nr:arginine/serine-rich protein PNISR [Neocloeon triangulifer]